MQVYRKFVYNFGVVMTEEEKNRLSTFEARVRHLMYLHDELRLKNSRLQQQLEEKTNECEQAKAEYRTLEQHYNDLKTAATISLDGNDVKETQQRLSQLVREIDKCIALLNKQ